MTISGPSSYPPTIGEFASHWQAVNTELAAGGPYVLPEGTDVAQLLAWRDDLEAKAAEVENLTNDREIARGFIDQGKSNLLARLGEFNRKVRGSLGKTPYARALPDTFAMSAGEARTLRPLNDMASLWGKINAATIPNFTGPLTLLDGYELATCQADIAALKSAYHDYQDADQQLSLERQKRNDVQDLAYAAMRDYRLGVAGLFAPDHALVNSLPALNPTSGGSSSGGSLPAPGGLALAAQPDAMVVADWDDVAGAEHYVLLTQTAAAGEPFEGDFEEEPTTFFESGTVLGPFDLGTQLRVKVRAETENEVGPESEVAEVKVE